MVEFMTFTAEQIADLGAKSTAMLVLEEGTAGTDDYIRIDACIHSDREAYAEYTASYYIDSAITSDEFTLAEDYHTDGYTLQFRFELGGDWTGEHGASDPARTVACASGNKTFRNWDWTLGEWYDVTTAHTTCAQVYIVWTDNGDGTQTPSLGDAYTDLVATEFQADFNSLYGVVGTDGFENTYAKALAEDSAEFEATEFPENASYTIYASRFMVTADQYETETDIRYDSNVENFSLGYFRAIGAETNPVWVEAEWMGAVQVATAAGAAVLAALTF